MPLIDVPDGGMEDWVQRTVETFSPNALRAARRRRKWSLDDLADVSGISATSLGAWERGAARPTVTNLATVAAALDLAVSDLLRQRAGTPTLTDYRVAVGLTVAAAADTAGLSATSVARAENAQGRLTDRIITGLSNAYGVTEEEIEQAWNRTRRERLARLRKTPF
jgi:transcriptional regulator with XRE-family HTH domain